MHTEPFRKRLYKICDQLEIARKSPHDMRKTYATILLDNQTDRKFITSVMGHVDVNTTENFYHKDRRSLAQKASMINSIPDFQKIHTFL